MKILKIELEDIEEDIQTLLDLASQRKKEGQITNYVFFHNVALFKNEISGINNFIQCLDTLDPGAYENLDALIAVIDDLYKQRTKDHHFPEGVYAMVHRKLKKIARYVIND